MSHLPLANTQIDSYRIVKEIGRGGMAHIFEAIDIRTGDSVALKMLMPTSDSESLSDRFIQEFKALSRLKHPNVLQVFECGTFGARPYFTMELLNGITLKESIPTWMTLPTTERFAKARHILIQMAAALDHIHQRGWIHRDVTPSNIMLLDDGGIKLMDFGVVKIPGTERTVAGEMIGTVAYMAPEQIKNHTLDSRTDLYSLGASLYLMLTGQRPFNARTLGGYLQKHLTEEPVPPSQYAPLIPTDLESACLRLLQKSPDQRFASANHLLQYMSLSTTITKHRRTFGRTREMHLIQEKVAALSQGQGGVILLEGEHGMGKTQLLHAASRLLKEFSIPHTMCSSRSPQQPMYETFQPLFKELSQSERDIFLQSDSMQQDDSWELFSKVRSLMDDTHTRCVLLDNIERSDSASLKLLEFVINSSLDDDLPILFIITVDLDFTNSPIHNILGNREDATCIRHIPVSPLKSAAVEEWLLCFALNEPNIQLLAERLFVESEGAPFILDEMIKALKRSDVLPTNFRRPLNIESSQIATIPLPLPEAIQATLLQRMQNLPDLPKTILEMLTVSEQGLSLALTVEILQSLLQMDDISLQSIQKSVDRLTELDLIQTTDNEGIISLEIAHMWYKEILLPTLPQSKLQQYHRCLGLALERQHIQHIHRVVETLAHHFEQAQCHGKAYIYLWQSASKLRYRSMFLNSLEYLERAKKVEPLARAHIALYDADEKLANILLTQSFLSHQLNKTINAQSFANQADQIAGEQHNHALLAKVATEKARQARDLYNLGEADLQIKRALRYADLSGQPNLSILPLYENGALLWEAGQPERARELFERALSLSEQLHNAFGIAKVNNGLGVLAMSLGDSPQARKCFEASIAHSIEHRRIEDLVVAQTNLAELFHCIGYFKKALLLLNQSITESLRFRYDQGVSIALRHSSILLIDLGRYTEAQEQAQSALELNRTQHNQQEYLASLVVWLRCHFSSGNWHQVDDTLEEALKLLPSYDSEGYSPIVLSWKARMVMHLHQDTTTARFLLRTAANQVNENRKFQEVRCLLNIARGWKAVNEIKLSIQFAEKALAIANQCGYRYYAMRSRQLLSTIVSDPTQQKRHANIAQSLTRSLASSLSKSDADSFLSRNMIQ